MSTMKFFIGTKVFVLEVKDIPGNPRFLSAGITSTGSLELTFAFADTTPANNVFEFIKMLEETIERHEEVTGTVEHLLMLAEIHIIADISVLPAS